MSDSLNGDTSRTKFPFNYPLKVNNSFTQSIAEDLGYKFPRQCKRCGKEFMPKYKEHIFCSTKCVSIYRNKINGFAEYGGVINKHGQSFLEWLEDSFDCEYSPEKF